MKKSKFQFFGQKIQKNFKPKTKLKKTCRPGPNLARVKKSPGQVRGIFVNVAISASFNYYWSAEISASPTGCEADFQSAITQRKKIARKK